MNDERRQAFEEVGLTEADEPAYELFIKFFKAYWKEAESKLIKEIMNDEPGIKCWAGPKGEIEE